MKNKLLLAAVMLGLIISLAGCSLAKEEPSNGAAFGDKLIGVYITTEYINTLDYEQFVIDNIDSLEDGELIMPEETVWYQDRVYAECIESSDSDVVNEYVFPDIEGIRLLSLTHGSDDQSYTALITDEGLSGVHQSFLGTDDGKAYSVSADIYIVLQGDTLVHVNPVYIDKSGRVYLVPEMGALVDNSCSSLKLDYSGTEEIKTGDKTSTNTTSVSVNIIPALAPEMIRIIQMNGRNEQICVSEHVPGEMPEKLIAEEETEYIIIESHCTDDSGDAVVTRQLWDGTDGETIKTLYKRSSGILAQQQTEVVLSR